MDSSSLEVNRRSRDPGSRGGTSRDLLRSRPDPVIEKVLQLNTLRGIGINSAWLYLMEFFGWREFRNGKEVGSLAGLTPTPFQSGNRHREQGVSHAGNRHVRGMSVEIAWGWLRQPVVRRALQSRKQAAAQDRDHRVWRESF